MSKEKKPKILLTNEEITKQFKSNFELVNYAIKLAENMIKTGRDSRVKSDVKNRAMLILAEIHEGKDQFDDIEVLDSASQELGLDAIYSHLPVHEDRPEKRKIRSAASAED